MRRLRAARPSAASGGASWRGLSERGRRSGVREIDDGFDVEARHEHGTVAAHGACGLRAVAARGEPEAVFRRVEQLLCDLVQRALVVALGGEEFAAALAD